MLQETLNLNLVFWFFTCILIIWFFYIALKVMEDSEFHMYDFMANSADDGELGLK
jgi:hypothetical protein